MNLNGKNEKFSKPMPDLNMDKLLDDKLIEVELRKEETECDSYVKLLEDGAREPFNSAKYDTRGNCYTFFLLRNNYIISRYWASNSTNA